MKVDAEGAVVALKSREDSAEDEGLLQCFDGLSETLLAKPDRALASSIRLEVRLAPPPVERIQLKAQDGENVGALIGAVREPDSVWAYDPPDLKLYGRLESSDVEKAVGKLKKRIAKAYRGSPTEERVEAGEKAMLLIRFVVPRGGGRMDRVRAAGNDGVDEALEAELLALFGKLKLPAPKGGGIAQVTYPLVFE